MKAAVTLDKQVVTVKQVPTPVPAEDELLVKVLCAGICGGDVRMYKGTFPYLNYPIINGHEFSGIVVKKGAKAVGFEPGDYVTAEPIVPCHHCYACSVGKINCCSHLKVLGVHQDGCFAEYICVKAERAYKLPESIPPEDGCMVEPYGIAMHALNRLAVVGGESLLILGAGPIGLAALESAKTTGLRVLIDDVYQTRLDLARRLGADMTVDPNECDLAKAVFDFTDGEGFPAILEATGVPTVMQSTQEFVANGGRICIAGVINRPVEISSMTFCNKEATILGTRNSVGVFPELIRLFQEKKLHPECLRTNIFSLDDYAEAIKLAAQSTGSVCKIVIRVAG